MATFTHRHLAYNLNSGEIFCWNHGNQLKRIVARIERSNRLYFNLKGQWRWCHDYGKRWHEQGFPTR